MGWFLSSHSGRRVSRWLFPGADDSAFRALVLRAWAGGLLSQPGTARQGTYVGRSRGGRRKPGPGFRGAPQPLLLGLHGLRAQPALGFQQRLDAEGSGPSLWSRPVL